ncbi:ABC transporter substrate-binding protein [Massilia sp. W12]|uniref:ABC transporter substrate-binding protein n=1 Tax=Massilia sp. W12 TaxID=3126507 RepID=UPI0030D17F9E
MQKLSLRRRKFLASLARNAPLALAAISSTPLALAAPAPAPAPQIKSNNAVIIGLDAEFGLENSYSAQAVELGIKVAMAEINANGGVLNGRQLELATRDNRAMPARGIRNLSELAALPNLVAVFGARFSPVIIEQLPKIQELQIPFLAVWSSADPIIDNNMQPNYVFRLSLRDNLAMPKMLQAAAVRGFDKVGLLLTNTAWGRSNKAAAEKYILTQSRQKIVDLAWYNWKDPSLLAPYQKLQDAGAQAVLLVANDVEAAILMKEIAALPPNRRLPVFSHWGITGGDFAKTAGPALREVDLSVIQTFSFFTADKTVLARFMKYLAEISEIRRIDEIQAPVGVAHAYDMTHLLAQAVNQAGSTDRNSIRNALEKLKPWRGLVKSYAPAFTPGRHEALSADELLMARYRSDGVLIPAQK